MIHTYIYIHIYIYIYTYIYIHIYIDISNLLVTPYLLRGLVLGGMAYHLHAFETCFGGTVGIWLFRVWGIWDTWVSNTGGT